jgi:hypothetical protein
MRKFQSAIVALVLFVIASVATHSRAADFYDWGIIREWHDASGNIIGYFYKPCPEDPGGETFSWGLMDGPADVTERWMCDPITEATPEPCEFWLFLQNSDGSGFQILIRHPCGL